MTSIRFGLFLLAPWVAAAAHAGAGYPPPDRPVAEIVSPIWNTEKARDAADESGQLVRALGIVPGMIVADVGAGSGYHTVRLSPVVGPDGRILAQDVNGAYLDDLRIRVKDLANVTIVAGDPDDPKLPPRSADLAILVHMYHEIASPYAFMARLSATIKPGGTVAIVDLDKATHRHGTPVALLRCELTAVGYRETGYRELEGGIGYVMMFEPPPDLPQAAAITPCHNPDRHSVQQPARLRPFAQADWPAVAALVTEAFTAEFGQSDDAALVQRLRKARLIEIELVAEQGGAIAGHIVFSRLGVETGGRAVKALALAPVSAKVGGQQRGIGGRLIEAGHAIARDNGFEAIFLLGHPGYYPRFGYSAAAARPFASPFTGNHFMALALIPGALDTSGGTITYPPAWQL